MYGLPIIVVVGVVPQSASILTMGTLFCALRLFSVNTSLAPFMSLNSWREGGGGGGNNKGEGPATLGPL